MESKPTGGQQRNEKQISMANTLAMWRMDGKDQATMYPP